MALELRQQLKLSQQLVMTPQLQQAIKLLQLSRLELLETVQQELLENPFLEEAQEEVALEKQQETPAEERVATTDDADAVVNKELEKNADWEDYLGEFSSTTKQMQFRESETPEEGMSFEARLTHKPSLEGHLFWQLRLSNMTELQLAIGEVVIGNLSSTGYLQASAQDIADMVKTTEEDVEAVLHQIQRYDPIGVAARTPQECLLVQLEFFEYEDPLVRELIRDHLEDLEKRRYKPLCRKFKISMDQLKGYLDMIQKLDPMPGASFG
ncbi:MAG: RNA polymerase sigma-54 factor, partial [Desulfovibrio sp.]